MGSRRKYDETRDSCRSSGTVYSDDDEFPASVDSIGRHIERLQWTRPPELCQEPKWTVRDAHMSHFLQGELGNCWFASSVASLVAHSSKMLGTVACDDLKQGFDDDLYCGAFCFRFWQYDDWVTVIVDDRLPTVDGRLVFMHSQDGDHFLGALMEKAYAKLHGSYQALAGGHAAEALTDLTAGLVTLVPSEETLLSSVVQRAHFDGLPVVASITEDCSDGPRTLDNGLTVNHGYAVLECTRVAHDGSSTNLLRLWDSQSLASWNGDWSHNSDKWQSLPSETKDQGEFWISEEDFSENFTSVEVCHCECAPAAVGDEPDSRGRQGTTMYSVVAKGTWPVGSNDGSFENDPQFELTVNAGSSDGHPSLLVELTQMNQGHGSTEYLLIRFRVFALEDDESLPLDAEALDGKHNLSNKVYVESRSVVEQFSLAPGRYAVVASTAGTSKDVAFVLRVQSETASSLIAAQST